MSVWNLTGKAINIDSIKGFPDAEMDRFRKLIDVYNVHFSKNREKDKYYEGNISLNDVNLGLALPDGIRKLEIGCSWGAKTVDVLAARSMFDGFVGENGSSIEELDAICRDNDLIGEYMKACRDELKYGCTFATLSSGGESGCKIRFHSPMTAAALWDGELNRISCGFAIIDTAPDEILENEYVPSLINYYTDTAIWEIRREESLWYAREYRHRMGRPLMEPLIWNATSNKPFGRSRIKEPVRRLIQGYVRTIANATIGLEFATAPQKYLMGVTDEQYDAVVNQKFKQYVGSIIAATTNPETEQPPSFGQLPQGSIAPHVEMIRVLATQFSAATGLTVTDTGVVNDANPTSSEAILAQSQTLVAMAEQLNAANGTALQTIAIMALAISRNESMKSLPEEDKDVMAHFKNPAMPSVSVTADAAIKIASAREGFSQTDTFLEMIGFDQADIRRIKAQESKARGLAVLEELENDNITKNVGEIYSEAQEAQRNSGEPDDGIPEIT